MEEERINDMPQPDIPYIVHEGEMARMERANKRWFTAWLITFLLLVGCVAGFIWYESQFEETSVTQDVDTGEGAAYVTGIGDVYGEGKTDSQAQNP